MKPPLNNYLFEEALRIISTNKSKANYLRQSILNTINYESDFNLKIRQYLGEFEYDLNILYEIIRDIKLSFDRNQTTLNNSTTVGEAEGEGEEQRHIIYRNFINTPKNLRKNNSSKFFNNYKNKLFLKEFDDNSVSESNKKRDETFSLTINIHNDSHFNTNPKNNSNQKRNRSNSFKSYKGKNKNKQQKMNNSGINYKYFINNKILNNNIDDNDNDNDYAKDYANLFKNNKLNKNNKTYTYIMDYSSKNDKLKTQNNSKLDLFKSNINKNKASLKNLKSLYDNYKSILNNRENNKSERIPSYNNCYSNDKNNNHTFDGSHRNIRNNIIPTLQLETVENNNYNIYQNKQDDYNNDNYNGNKYNNIYSNNNMFLRDNILERNNTNNKPIDDLRFEHIIDLENNLKQRENINKNDYLNRRNSIIFERQKNGGSLNLNNDIIDDDIFEEDKKKEIIKNIISIVLQDANKINEIKKYMGDDIGEKLLEGDVSQQQLFKIIEILKKYQANLKNNIIKNDKNLFRGSKNNYKNNSYKKIDSLNNIELSYKDYPLGLLSMNNNLNN